MEETDTALQPTKTALDTTQDTAVEKAADQTIVDGKGSLSNLTESITSLRYVAATDIGFLFHLANTPSIRAASFCDAPITWEEHVRWFQKKLQQTSSFFILEYNQEPCGYVRFSDTMGWVDVSIAISPEARGKKVALVGLQRACKRFFVQEPAIQGIRAFVKTTNQPSMKLFERAGFIRHANEQHGGICVAHFSLAKTTNPDTR